MNLPPHLRKKVLALAGESPPPRSTRHATEPVVRTQTGFHWSITFRLPVRVLSEANRHRSEHWSRQHRRKTVQAETLGAAFLAMMFALEPTRLPKPLTVTWTHVGPKMDSDNLARAFKGLRDAMAAWLGVDDGDDRVGWKYERRTGQPGVEVTIEAR